jgi:dual specificity phosphatase 12
MNEKANLIIDRLWLGNLQAAMDGDFLHEKGITVVFNCTKTAGFHHSVKRQYRVPVDDNLEEDEIRNMELWSFEIVTKLMREYSAGRTVLVHCHAGVQRSAAVVTMFLMAVQRITPDEAMAFLRTKRPVVFHGGVNFEKAIRGFHTAMEQILLKAEAEMAASKQQ